jgi:hypothetical protein
LLPDFGRILRRIARRIYYFEDFSMSDTLIAIVGGEVRAVVALGYHEQEVLAWTRDPKVEQIVRVPTEVARQFLFEKWPGLEQATRATPDASTPKEEWLGPDMAEVEAMSDSELGTLLGKWAMDLCGHELENAIPIVGALSEAARRLQVSSPTDDNGLRLAQDGRDARPRNA